MLLDDVPKTTKKYVEYVNNGLNIDDIKKIDDVDEELVRHFLSRACLYGSYDEKTYELLDNYYKNRLVKYNRVLVIADTHLGGIYEDYNLLYKTYDFSLKNNYKFIIHLGDIISGTVNYVFERSKDINYQIEDFLNRYPTSNDFMTCFISGNHDYFTGIEKAIPKKKNCVFAGDLRTYIDLYNNDHRLFLFHTNAYCKYIPKFNYDLKLSGHSHLYGIDNEYNEIHVPALSNASSIHEKGFITLDLYDHEYLLHRYCVDQNENLYLREKTLLKCKKI